MPSGLRVDSTQAPRGRRVDPTKPFPAGPPRRIADPVRGRLAVTCWCERKIMHVPVEVIQRGETVACAHPRCGPPA